MTKEESEKKFGKWIQCDKPDFYANGKLSYPLSWVCIKCEIETMFCYKCLKDHHINPN